MHRFLLSCRRPRFATLSRRFSATAPFPFSVTPGAFNSVSFDASSLNALDSVAAADYLTRQVTLWREQGINSVWVRAALPGNAALLGLLTGPLLNFTVHHASGKNVTLLLWLREGASKVPPFGGTQVGVGGVTVDLSGRLLVVRERSARSAGGGGDGFWKFPGGLAEPGEDIGAAAVREVWEETGVRTSFYGILGFRHVHGLGWGLSDIYFLALLKPIAGARGAQGDPLPIEIDPVEIAQATWRDGELYARESAHPFNAAAARLALSAARSTSPSTSTVNSTSTPFWENAKPHLEGVHESHDVFIGFGVSKKWTKIYTNAPISHDSSTLSAAAGVVRDVAPLPPWERNSSIG